MLFTTPTLFAVLVLVLVAGWLLGLASHPGGRKWRERYAAEREAHAAYRRDADARVAEAERRAAERDRIVERDRGVMAPVTAAPVVATAPVGMRASTVSAASSARPAYATGERRGWFDWGRPVSR